MVSFTFVREGSSDDGLIPHLRTLILRAGAQEVVGTSLDVRGPVLDRLRKASMEASSTSIVFVHRDADGPSSDLRHEEIQIAAVAAGMPRCVGVVPVQELEAWLLVDEQSIRAVVGRPTGRTPLGLPRVGQLERVGRPKEVLATALLLASETTGRRKEQEKKRFLQRRHALLGRLNIDGPLKSLPSWQRLESDVAAAVGTVLSLDSW